MQPSKGIKQYPLSRITIYNFNSNEFTNQRINIGSIKARMFVVLSRWEGQSAGFFFSLLWLIFLKPDSLRISPRSRTIFLEAACIILYRDSDANSKDCRARPSPARTRRECEWKGSLVLLLELGFFQRRRKAGLEGRSLRETRRVARLFCDETSRKNRGKRRESARGSSAKCDKSRGYALFQSFSIIRMIVSRI